MGVRWTEDDYVDGLAVSTEKGVLELLNAMQASSVTLSSNSCLKLLKAFEKESKSVQSAELGRFMLENGHAFEVKAVDSVILAHIKTSNVTGAMSFLQELVDKNKKSLELGDRSGCVAKSPSLSVLNKLIHLACEQGRMGDAKSLFNLMIQNAVMPTLETMTYLLKGFANADDVNGVELIHKRLAFFKMKPDLVFLTILASAYISAGQMSEAQRILDDLKTLKISPDAFFFNALLNGYGKLGDLHSMQKTYFSMVEEGVDPDEATFTIIIDAHMRAGDIRTALVWMESTLGLTPPQNVSFKPHKPTKPSMHSFSAIINGFSSSQRLELAQTWFDRMVEHGLPPNQIVYTALIRGYIRSRKVKIARKLQEDMATAGLKQDIKLFNIMIYSQTWFNDFKKAFMTLKSMKQIGVKPDAITYGILIDGLLKFKHFKRAVKVFAEMREIGLKPTLHTYIAIITTLGHYGGFGIIESSPKDKEHGPIREVGSGDTLKVSQETSQETVVNSRPSLLDSRLQVREDLQAIYISYRDHVHASNIDPILDIYDAVMASHINTGDVESAFEVLIDAIKDNCIIDTSLVVRLAKGVGFRRGWRGILAISQKAKQMAYLRLAYSSPLDGIREDLSLGTVPTVEDEKDEKKKGVAGKFNFHRHWADEIPLMLVEV
ncbi:hypothetical protein BC829DRAFT_157791 [Chytridium lagenaria]|nr:hypothetical protein BC829DRAFT_157791 [Chytridium lagenaria]